MEDANAAMKDPPKVVLRCKLCMVGDAGVGKTALIEVFTKGGSKFPKNYSMVRARSAACPSPSCARPSPAHIQANAQQTRKLDSHQIYAVLHCHSSLQHDVKVDQHPILRSTV